MVASVCVGRRQLELVLLLREVHPVQKQRVAWDIYPSSTTFTVRTEKAHVIWRVIRWYFFEQEQARVRVRARKRARARSRARTSTREQDEQRWT